MSSSGDGSWRGAARPGAGELLVSEVFGPTLQGEGPSAGRTAAFVRLGGCNLSCRWCDTSYTWDSVEHDLSRELRVRPTGDVAVEVLALGTRLVVLTGGEPALQLTEAAELCRHVGAEGVHVEMETSGSVALGELADAVSLVVVSPKLSGSAVSERARLRWDVLRGIAALPHSVFKFVVSDEADLAEADGLVDR